MPVELALALMGKVINRPVIMAIEMGKAPLQWQIRTRGVPQMPFAENSPVFVTSTRQVFAQKRFGRIHTESAPGRNDGFAEPEAVGVAASHQPRSRGRAYGSRIITVQDNPFAGQLIEVGG